MQLYVHQNGQQLGPFTEEEIRAQLAAGKIGAEDLVWWEGQQGWVMLGTTPYASSSVVPTPPPTSLAAAPEPVSAPAMTAPSPANLAPSVSRTSGLAIGALVCGILGLFVCLTSIVAVVLGHMGLREIKRTPGLQGRGMALAGLIMGYAALLIYLAIFLFSFCLAFEKGMMIRQDQEREAKRAAVMNQVEAERQAAAQQADAARQSQATTNAAPGQ